MTFEFSVFDFQSDNLLEQHCFNIINHSMLYEYMLLAFTLNDKCEIHFTGFDKNQIIIRFENSTFNILSRDKELNERYLATDLDEEQAIFSALTFLD